jgi:hypothetical protein
MKYTPLPNTTSHLTVPDPPRPASPSRLVRSSRHRRFAALWFALAGLLGLFPHVVHAGPGVAGTAHDFAKWDKEIAAFETTDRTNPPPRGAVLFIGSSTIRLWKTLARDFPSHPAVNRGFGGCEIVDCTHFADRILLPLAPKMVFLRAGGNDINNGKPPEQVFADYLDFVAVVQAKLPETEIAFISLSPSIARWKNADRERVVNALIAAHAATRPRLHYIETYDLPLGPDRQPRPEIFATDKLHFNTEGYRLLADRVRPFLPR